VLLYNAYVVEAGFPPVAIARSSVEVVGLETTGAPGVLDPAGRVDVAVLKLEVAAVIASPFRATMLNWYEVFEANPVTDPFHEELVKKTGVAPLLDPFAAT
jgi:hypothetical protein